MPRLTSPTIGLMAALPALADEPVFLFPLFDFHVKHRGK